MNYEEYLKIAPCKTRIHYWDLPENVSVGFRSIPRRMKIKRNVITIRKLIKKVGKNDDIEKEINFIGKRKIKIKLPVNLNNINYVRLYALMITEGSTKTQFNIHVPEREFHELFRKSLINIFGRQIEEFIICKEQKGIPRSKAPSIIRFLLPTPNVIPKIIFQNKRFSREYLRIVFEAEGSPIFVGNKRYISLKRNSDTKPLLNENLNYPIGKRIYFKQLIKDHPLFAQKIKENPDKLTIGEKILLKEYFDINTTILPECIRINKTDFRCGGKISIKWDIYIYARNVNSFIKKIGFLSKSKVRKSERMLKFSGQREQFFAFEIMKKLSKNNIFTTSKFVEEMKKLGYKSPRSYIWRYKNSGKINKIERGKYNISNTDQSKFFNF